LSLNKKGTILKADVHGCTNVAMPWMARSDLFNKTVSALLIYKYIVEFLSNSFLCVTCI